MSSRTEVLLHHRPTQQYVSAVLIDGVTKKEVETAEEVWRPVMREALSRMEAENVPRHLRPQHGHWDWRKKHKATAHLLAYQTIGVECEGMMQGLMLLQTAGVFCRLESQKNRALAYVVFIETAPWNSPLVVREPQYRHVGTVLLTAAIDISEELGFKGRIGLHALPQVESWYAKHCNMTDLGPDSDPKHQNLRYFEMTPEQASEFRT